MKLFSNKNIDVKARANRLLLLGDYVILGLLFLGYILNFCTTPATRLYSSSLMIMIIIAAIIIGITYKSKGSKNLPNVALICMLIVYFAATIKTDNDLTYTMVFPIVMMFLTFYDMKIITKAAVLFELAVIIDMVYQAAVLKQTHSGGPIVPQQLLLEFLCSIVFMVIIVGMTAITNDNNKNKIAKITEVSDKVTDSIGTINDELMKLEESSTTVKNAMEEINTGVNDTSEAVSKQAAQTEQIQDQIEAVQSAANNISVNVSETMSAVEEGSRDINSLVEEAEASVEISQTVGDNLNALKDKMSDMSEITNLIESIAFQTNIMALNANVEAARAGEAGRGFAVVATEISNMATKTHEATDNIAGLINNTTNSLNELVHSVNDLSELIEKEKIMTAETSEVFEQIRANTEGVQDQVGTFVDNMQSLTNANREIMNSIQTISAVSEEVSALSNEALNTERKNAAALGEIASEVEKLASEAENDEEV